MKKSTIISAFLVVSGVFCSARGAQQESAEACVELAAASGMTPKKVAVEDSLPIVG